MQPAVDLRTGDVGALAVNPFESAAFGEIRDGLPYGHPANAQPAHEGPLGRNGVPGVQFGIDQLLENAAHMHPLGGGSAKRSFEPIAVRARASGPRIISSPCRW